MSKKFRPLPLTKSWLLVPVSLILLFLISACNSVQTVDSSGPAGGDPLIFVNPYKSECEINGNLQLCYEVSVGDTGNFSPFTGEIKNFEYEWDYGYSLKGVNDGNVITVEEVVEKTAEPGGIKYTQTLTGGDGRIVEISDGLFEFYGEKTFVCSPDANCDALRSEIDQVQPIAFDFETQENPGAPYTLLSWATN